MNINIVFFLLHAIGQSFPGFYVDRKVRLVLRVSSCLCNSIKIDFLTLNSKHSWFFNLANTYLFLQFHFIDVLYCVFSLSLYLNQCYS